jgi:hypothetical protein
MKIKKLTELEDHRLSEASRHLNAVLIPLKRKPLKGAALEHMQRLEMAINQIDCFRIEAAD